MVRILFCGGEDKNLVYMIHQKYLKKASKNPSLSKGFSLKKAGHLVTTHQIHYPLFCTPLRNKGGKVDPRQYGDVRTDTSDYSKSLAMLVKNVGAWHNSGVRNDAPAMLKEYMDSLPKDKLRSVNFR